VNKKTNKGKSKRWGSEWTREEKRQERGYPGPTRSILHRRYQFS